jgi:Flp pilus assembly protein TadD
MIGVLLTILMAGCNATGNVSSDFFASKTSGTEAFAFTNADATTRLSTPYTTTASVDVSRLGSEPKKALGAGKKYFRVGHFEMARRYFERAIELHSRDPEAWVGLAASYDQLGRFDLADRAYAQAVRLAGATAVILNNQGYSYMLRGEYARARKTLIEARRKDPANRFVRNNLALLAQSQRDGKAID